MAEAPPAPAPTAPPVSTRYNPRVPLYQRSRPAIGVELVGSSRGVSADSTIPDLGSTVVRGFQLSAEYQPQFLQGVGVVSIGAQLSAYPIFETTNATSSKLALWSWGGQIRYQARWFREQPLVPVVGFEMARWRYSLADGSTGSFNVQGPVLGAMLLLNVLDPGAAAGFYANHGVMRSYLVAEMHQLTGEDALIQLTGNTYFFGLRFEF